MSSLKQKQKAEYKIKEFIENFKLEFDIEVLVTIKGSKNTVPKITLLSLEGLVNDLLHKSYPGKYPKGIRTKKRKHELVNFRFCFYKIALDMGYTLTFIASFIGFTHATVISGNKVISNLLITKDIKSVFNLYNIYYELQKRFGIDAGIQPDQPTEHES